VLDAQDTLAGTEQRLVDRDRVLGAPDLGVDVGEAVAGFERFGVLWVEDVVGGAVCALGDLEAAAVGLRTRQVPARPVERVDEGVAVFAGVPDGFGEREGVCEQLLALTYVTDEVKAASPRSSSRAAATRPRGRTPCPSPRASGCSPTRSWPSRSRSSR
jgi:hypothetical protein